uniref:Zinc finger protein 14-like n=1 Tax=Erpetoichthys calabaricus TaxID=27687 RepID=A0A8C4TTE0_ERPCA
MAAVYPPAGLPALPHTAAGDAHSDPSQPVEAGAGGGGGGEGEGERSREEKEEEEEEDAGRAEACYTAPPPNCGGTKAGRRGGQGRRRRKRAGRPDSSSGDPLCHQPGGQSCGQEAVAGAGHGDFELNHRVLRKRIPINYSVEEEDVAEGVLAEEEECLKDGETLLPKQRKRKRQVVRGQVAVDQKETSDRVWESSECGHCGRVFSRKYNYQRHFRLVHAGRRSYKKYKRVGKVRLEAGQRAQINEDNPDVKTLSKKQIPNDGKPAENGEKPFVCDKCGKSYSSSAFLQNHQQMHCAVKTVPEKPHKCSVCGKGYSYLESLKKHQLAHSPLSPAKNKLSEKPYKCSQCEKAYSYLAALHKHQQNHGDFLPFKCPDCGKQYQHWSLMKIHQRKHTNDQPYQCLQCSKKFKHRCSLYQHQVTHKKPHRCPICDKAFATAQSMRSHQKLHQEKPFRCPQCPKGYSTESLLKDHLSSHAGKKIYNCNDCGKSFRNLNNLQDHQNIHTGQTPYQCQLCLKEFSWLEA